ncbi:MAG: hypothetical protein K2L22_07195 [Muribaculaceae bacterium]|nr:hypothetical protein [Muribaculaceae bacterium]
MIRNIFFALLLIIHISCFAQTSKTVSKTRYDWSGLAESITQGKTNNYDKAYAIYRWLCENIDYDTSYSIHKADDAYKKKRGVCQAYCEMFFRLGNAVGLDVDIIGGKAKDKDGKIFKDGHAWVFVRTNGDTGILIDPTWGAGSVDNGQFIRSEMDDSWFHVDPKWMIFTHYPDSESYQLLDDNVDYSSFISLPSLDPSLGNLGYNADELLASSLDGNALDIPKYLYNSKIKIVNVPLPGTLRVGEPYDFIIEPEDDYEFVIINEEEQDNSWELDNRSHRIKFVPAESGNLVVGYRHRGSNDNWTHMISYKVADSTSGDISNLEMIAPHKSPVFKNLLNFDSNRLRNRGVDMGKLLAMVRQDNIMQLPLIYDAGDFKLNDVPLNGKLKVGESYRFAFSPNEEGDWVIINNGVFLREWTQDPLNNSWVMTIIPSAPGKVVLAFKPSASTDNKFSYCVEYDVEN